MHPGEAGLQGNSPEKLHDALIWGKLHAAQMKYLQLVIVPIGGKKDLVRFKTIACLLSLKLRRDN